MLASAGAVNVPSLPNVHVLTRLVMRLTLMPASPASIVTAAAVDMLMSVCQLAPLSVASNVLVNLPGIRLVDNVQPSAENLVAAVSNCARKP